MTRPEHAFIAHSLVENAPTHIVEPGWRVGNEVMRRDLTCTSVDQIIEQFAQINGVRVPLPKGKPALWVARERQPGDTLFGVTMKPDGRFPATEVVERFYSDHPKVNIVFGPEKTALASEAIRVVEEYGEQDEMHRAFEPTFMQREFGLSGFMKRVDCQIVSYRDKNGEEVWEFFPYEADDQPDNYAELEEFSATGDTYLQATERYFEKIGHPLKIIELRGDNRRYIYSGWRRHEVISIHSDDRRSAIIPRVTRDSKFFQPLMQRWAEQCVYPAFERDDKTPIAAIRRMGDKAARFATLAPDLDMALEAGRRIYDIAQQQRQQPGYHPSKDILPDDTIALKVNGARTEGVALWYLGKGRTPHGTIKKEELIRRKLGDSPLQRVIMQTAKRGMTEEEHGLTTLPDDAWDLLKINPQLKDEILRQYAQLPISKKRCLDSVPKLIETGPHRAARRITTLRLFLAADLTAGPPYHFKFAGGYEVSTDGALGHGKSTSINRGVIGEGHEPHSYAPNPDLDMILEENKMVRASLARILKSSNAA